MIQTTVSRVAALCLGLGTLAAPAAEFILPLETTNVVPSTRGQENTTYFGWDTFEAPADPENKNWLDDTTPDRLLLDEEETPVQVPGARFETTNEQLHRAGSGNFYSGHLPTAVIAEKVTVPTSGTPGPDGTTTIIAQLIGSGAFPQGASWTFGSINGVEPEVFQATNAANKGQVWVKWVLPGNAAAYEFTIGGTPLPNQHMSFDKIDIDTHWSADTPQEDIMLPAPPQGLATIMDDGPSSIVTPSSRGGANTTFFGWETFNNPGAATVIDDSTPDIGSDPTGLARFRTSNEQVHQFSGGGNLYFLSGTLAEEITVPTDGVVGEEGSTTIILQITSAVSGMGGASFAGPITATIDGQTVTAVQASNSTSAHFWAKWEIPGNQETYTIAISGPENQAHFSFDKVVVDTKYSPYANNYVADTMRGHTVEFDTLSLPPAFKGLPYSLQLQANGGTTPYAWSLFIADAPGEKGSPLPAGLTLGADGLISGTVAPEAELGPVEIVVVVEDENGFSNDVLFTLDVESSLEFTAPAMPTAVVGYAYEVAFTATLGHGARQWTVSEGTLPEGLSLDEETGVLSGTPAAAGTAAVTVTVTDEDEASVSQEIEITVSPALIAPVLDAVQFAGVNAGASFLHTLTAANYPETFSVTGLPKGLTLNAGTGVISGSVTTAGVYLVQVSASNSGGSSATVTAPLVIKALPATQVGAFSGLIARDETANGGLGSSFNLTTTGTGAFTVKVRTGSATKSAKGFLNGDGEVNVDINGSALALTLDADTGLVTGTHGAAAANGWLNVWDRKFNPPSSLEGYYSAALDLADEDDLDNDAIPHGVGYSAFTIPATGQVKVTGRTADGQAIVAATTLGPNGELAVYAPMYQKKGSLLGLWAVNVDAEGLFLGNAVTGSLSWQKPETKGRVYAAAFGPVELAVEGAYLGSAARRPAVLGLPAAGTFDIHFAGAGIEASDTVATVTGAVWTDKNTADLKTATNAAKVKLKVNKSTGAVTGSLSLADEAASRKNVKFAGQVVRTADGEEKALGYFLLPQLPGENERPNATAIRSGAFVISQGSAD